MVMRVWGRAVRVAVKENMTPQDLLLSIKSYRGFYARLEKYVVSISF